MPQVPEQVRKAPTLALRAVFTGIGKMLMAADRPGSRRGGPKPAAAPEYRLPEPAGQWDTLGPAAPQPRPEPEPAPPPPAAPAAAAAPAETQRWRSLDETGNVRLLTSEELSGGNGPVVTARPGGAAGAHAGRSASLAQPGQGPTSPVQPGPAARRPVAASSGDGPGGPSGQPLGGNVPVGSDLIIHAVPLPGYDSMSVASIRARLRTLDFDQLQALLVHERKNAGRPEVIAMIERRIEKLEAGA